MPTSERNNEFHHLFKHKSGGWYFQKHGFGKKCLRTKDSEEAKNARDVLLKRIENGEVPEKENLAGSIAGLLPELKKDGMEAAICGNIQRRTVFETSDNTIFFDLTIAMEYERTYQIGKLRVDLSKQLDVLFGNKDDFSKRISVEGFHGVIADLAVTSPDKLEAFSEIIGRCKGGL